MPSRRQTLIGIAGIATGTLATQTLTQNVDASAAVQANTLTVPNRDYAQTSKLQDVAISVDASWSFDADKLPDRWILTLLVSDDGTDYAEIAEERMAPSDPVNSGTTQLRGSIVDSPEFTLSQFQLDDGDSEKTQVIYVKLVFDVQIGDSSIATSIVEDTAELTVSPESIDATLSLSGSGEFVLSK